MPSLLAIIFISKIIVELILFELELCYCHYMIFLEVFMFLIIMSTKTLLFHFLLISIGNFVQGFGFWKFRVVVH
jgi:hypothetical protein